MVLNISADLVQGVAVDGEACLEVSSYTRKDGKTGWFVHAKQPAKQKDGTSYLAWMSKAQGDRPALLGQTKSLAVEIGGKVVKVATEITVGCGRLFENRDSGNADKA